MITLDGTTGITSPNDTTGNQSYTGTLTGGTGVVNLGSGQFYKDASGNIGVGTASPSYLLDVQGTTPRARVLATTGTNYAFYQTTNTGGSSYVGLENSAGSAFSTSAAYALCMLHSGAYPLIFGNSLTERMRIDSSGNVGIGTTSPTFATGTGLQVKGAGFTSVRITGASATGIDFSQDASANGYMYNRDNAALIYGTNNAERMRIDSSGNLLVGTTSSSPSSNVGVKTYPDGRVYSVSASSTNASENYGMYSTGAANYRFYVGWGGTIYATSIVITAISDQRLKENIKDIDTGIDTIMALKPRRFDWKDGKGQDKKNVAGFIAQEFETVFPECVGTTKAGEDGIEYKNINHETLIPTLVRAMQEQQAIIESLTTRLTALEAK